MLKSFFHTGFVVQDLDKAVDFYVNVLGMREAARTERQGEFANQLLAFPDAHIKGAFVDKGEGHQLELLQYLNPPSGLGGINRNDLGASHLAFFVEDIDRFYEETSQRGLRFNNPPASLQDDQGHLMRKALYAQDPDGNWLEFVELY
jgi:glyoxylase I family protein